MLFLFYPPNPETVILFKRSDDLFSYISGKKKSGAAVGFVPTMGALHAGHLSLIDYSRKLNDITVCSIFVNPAQFNEAGDLAAYPRTIEKDLELLQHSGCEVVFHPDVQEIYPKGNSDLKDYPLGHLSEILEGKSRPSHFRGVANVMDRLLHIVSPNTLFLGQKDFQQVKVIELLARQIMPQLRISMCPIIREGSGLAMSSRNVRLTEEEKKNAAGIFKTLQWMKERVPSFSLEELKMQAMQKLNSIPGVTVDYLEICDAESFYPATQAGKNQVAVTAVSISGVRLLDNIFLD